MLLVGIPVSGSGGIGLLHLVVGRFLVHHLRCGGFFLFLVDQGSLRATETGRERLVPEESEEEVRAGRSRHSSVWAGGVRCVQNGRFGVFFSVFLKRWHMNMEPDVFCFSPTGGGEKIARAIRKGLGDGCGKSPCIFVVPVYGGRMPDLAKKAFGNVHATGNNPAVLAVVYGNRAFEGALAELAAFVSERGFNPVAAGAFVCEHSYSTSETPVAAGRPDAEDLKAAEEFGRLAGEKILAGNLMPVNAADLQDEPSPEASVNRFMAFVREFKEQQSAAPRAFLPELDKDMCSGCGICLAVCPATAIRADFSIDASRCVACCACVKKCPSHAWIFMSPFARPLSENFSLRKSPRWIL